jgi:dephospho-CoA kinase
MIIGLSGKKHSGKTEVANYLSLKMGIPVYSFASPLKKLVNEMSGLSDDNKLDENYYTNKNIQLKPLYKELAKFNYNKLSRNEIYHIKAIEYYKTGEIYRMLLQYIGTNIFRNRNTNH